MFAIRFLVRQRCQKGYYKEMIKPMAHFTFSPREGELEDIKLSFRSSLYSLQEAIGVSISFGNKESVDRLADPYQCVRLAIRRVDITEFDVSLAC